MSLFRHNNTPINASLTELVSQYSDSTYSVVKGIGYDSTGKKIGLIVEIGGADTLVPFSSGAKKFCWLADGTNVGEAFGVYGANGYYKTVSHNLSTGTTSNYRDDDDLTIYVEANNYMMPVYVTAKRDITIKYGMYRRPYNTSTAWTTPYTTEDCLSSDYEITLTTLTLTAGQTQQLYDASASLGRYNQGFLYIEY